MSIDWSKAPEGATHYKPTVRMFLRVEDGYAHFFGVDGRWNRTDSHISQYPQGMLIEREWTGTGLPPVGTVCECQDSNLNWRQGTVVHIGIQLGTKVAVMQTDKEILWGELGEFRPIRTQEQIEAEERENAVDDMYETVGNIEIIPTWRDALFALYDAGYRKQPKEGA